MPDCIESETVKTKRAQKLRRILREMRAREEEREEVRNIEIDSHNIGQNEVTNTLLSDSKVFIVSHSVFG